MVLRFVSNEPSVLQVLDEDIGRDGLVQAVMLELEGRAVDEGRLSFWDPAVPGEDRIVAQHAARRARRDRARLFRVPDAVLSSAGLVCADVPDDATFSCVSDAHREIDLSREPSRRALAEALVEAARNGDVMRATHYRAITKGEIGNLVRIQYERCVQEGARLDASRAGEWVQPWIAAS